MDHYTIEAMLIEDWVRSTDIYLEGIESGQATFELKRRISILAQGPSTVCQVGGPR